MNSDSLEPTDQKATPPIYCDQVWSFTLNDHGSDVKQWDVHVGAYRGRINYFTIASPWIDKASDENSTPPLLVFLFMVCIVTGVISAAFRNLSLGRGDRRGAFRLALFIIVTMLLGWSINGISQSGTPFNLFGNLIGEKPMGHALQHAMIGWLLYIAVEPLARRWWPWSLVTWTRVLMGRFSDVQVGRDILVGGLLAGTLGLINWFTTQTVVWSGGLQAIPDHDFLLAGLELGHVMEARIAYAHGAVLKPLGLLVLLVFARVLLRNQWAACLAVLCVLTAVFISTNEQVDLTSQAISTLGNLAYIAAMLFVLVRFGVFATAVSTYILAAMGAGVTWDLSLWYAVPALSGLAICVALLAYGLHSSLGGRPLLREEARQPERHFRSEKVS